MKKYRSLFKEAINKFENVNKYIEYLQNVLIPEINKTKNNILQKNWRKLFIFSHEENKDKIYILEMHNI